MPTNQPKAALSPEEELQAIAAKISVMRDEEIALARSKKENQDEVARKELALVDLNAASEQAETKLKKLEKDLELKDAEYKELSDNLSGAQSDLAKAKSEKELAEATTLAEKEKLSLTSSEIRVKLAEIEAKEKELAEAVALWDARKAKAADVLKSI